MIDKTNGVRESLEHRINKRLNKGLMSMKILGKNFADAGQIGLKRLINFEFGTIWPTESSQKLLSWKTNTH